MKAAKVLTRATINPKIRDAQYAVRGPIVAQAMELQKQLGDATHNLPFDKIIECNIGNPQALGQAPITFIRQVLALANVPGLVDHPKAAEIFPRDAIDRARKYIDAMPGGTGAYSHSKGIEIFRQEVADFITKRDNVGPANPDDIFLTDGASQAVQSIIQALLHNENCGLMIPIPQYPLYSASIALNGGKMVKYYLDEIHGWCEDLVALRKSLNEARAEGIDVRALVSINPGNPTGQCLSRDDMEKVIRFCKEEGLLLMADEVYQENIYAEDKEFLSFRKVLLEMGSEYSDVELISFHSVSKGFLGECGRRGGYMEMVNICDTAKDELYKLASVSLCSNVEGQMVVGMMTNPPSEGDESYPLYVKERDEILESLKRRSRKLVAAYNQMEGVFSNDTDGALYTFPQITIPQKAIEAAKELGMQPDLFYCLEKLKHTGVVTVPGTGFGQEEGTWHFRSTILPSEEEIDSVIERTLAFHADFMDKYRD